MTYRGHIKNGVAVLDQPIQLPDGTPVHVQVERADSDFWKQRTALELAVDQRVQPIGSADDLAGDWPDDDSIDDFLAFIRQARR
jgi:hypothetical protein